MGYVKHFWAWGLGHSNIEVYRLASGHQAERLLSVGYNGIGDAARSLTEIAAQAICERLDEMAAAAEDRVEEGDC